MAIRAHVADNYAAVGINVTLVMAASEGARPSYLLRLVDGDSEHAARVHWEVLPDDPAGVIMEPTLMLGHEEARALLDALLRHYEGASDMHTARQDLLHERGRVDKLLGTVSELAGTLATAPRATGLRP